MNDEERTEATDDVRLQTLTTCNITITAKRPLQARLAEQIQEAITSVVLKIRNKRGIQAIMTMQQETSRHMQQEGGRHKAVRIDLPLRLGRL